MPLDLIPLHSGALALPSVSVCPFHGGTAGPPLPLALASGASTVLVQPLPHAVFSGGHVPGA